MNITSMIKLSAFATALAASSAFAKADGDNIRVFVNGEPVAIQTGTFTLRDDDGDGKLDNAVRLVVNGKEIKGNGGNFTVVTTDADDDDGEGCKTVTMTQEKVFILDGEGNIVGVDKGDPLDEELARCVKDALQKSRQAQELAEKRKPCGCDKSRAKDGCGGTKRLACSGRVKIETRKDAGGKAGKRVNKECPRIQHGDAAKQARREKAAREREAEIKEVKSEIGALRAQIEALTKALEESQKSN